MYKALGKGLEALIPTDALQTQGKVVEIDIENIVPNKYQARIHFDEKGLSELADSIHQRGLIQPIIVSLSQVGMYQLIAGERRWRAAKLAGHKHIPAIVRNVHQDREMFEYALIENIQREDLNPIEEASAYVRLMEEFHLTQEELAERLGKKRSSVANSVRLL
ncbi:MAG: ParB/RepB/Spo0J family partition protein, partial [Candidatus Methanofastidiosia archaeon]